MIDVVQFRANIGAFHATGPYLPNQKNKWKILRYISLKILVLLFFLVLACTLFFCRTKNFIFLKKIALKSHRTVLFATLCFYYYRAASYLFICVDVSLNPGPNFADSFFKFCHWNCNSIQAHNFSRVSLIQTYNAIHNFNLIAITETALREDVNNDQLDIPGFNLLRSDLPEQDSHGGVMLYHKIDLPTKCRLDLEGQSNMIVVELSISKKSFFRTGLQKIWPVI